MRSALLCLLLPAIGCGLVVGVDEFGVAPGATSSSTGGSSTTASGGMGGFNGTSSGGSGGMGGSSGSAGMGGGSNCGTSTELANCNNDQVELCVSFENDFIDRSNNALQITPVGTPGYSTGGAVGSALRLTGASALMVESTSDLTLDNLTLSLYVRLQRLPTMAEARFGLFDHADGYSMFVFPDGHVTFEVRFVNAPIASAAGTLTPGVWTHLVGTSDGASARLYVNGIDIGQATVTTPMVMNDRSFIGANDDGSNGNEFLLGELDELRILNRPLSAQEICPPP